MVQAICTSARYYKGSYFRFFTTTPRGGGRNKKAPIYLALNDDVRLHPSPVRLLPDKLITPYNFNSAAPPPPKTVKEWHPKSSVFNPSVVGGFGKIRPLMPSPRFARSSAPPIAPSRFPPINNLNLIRFLCN